MNISFTSKINFVPLDTFNKTAKSSRGFKEYESVSTKTDLHTRNVSDCTALFLVDGKKASGFHFCEGDNSGLEKKLDRQLEAAPTKGLIIGGKKTSLRPSSLWTFNSLLKKVQNSTSDISIFKNQPVHWRTSIHYSPKKDTYTIYSGYGDDFVKSKEDLGRAYKEISIAAGDELYINNVKTSR